MEDFSNSLVKDYTYWQVHVSKNQSYLGRCVLWCKREDALDLTQATLPEQQEMFVVLALLRQASLASFKPDWFNYAFLGNQVRHLHAHFVPRYAAPRVFAGERFEDPHYGWNYRSELDRLVSDSMVATIRDKYRRSLNAGAGEP